MKHTEESKRKISEKRKKWLAENPDKHPWKSSNKFKSKPCEKAKEFLKQMNIQFIGEYDPKINGRNFSIDIALPDKKIAIEINGNQHYEKTGELKPYYQKRQDLLEADGWTVYQVHYSACFNLEKWSDFANILKNSSKKVEFDYFNYVPRIKKMWFCMICGAETKYKRKYCRDCKSGSSSRIPTGNISLEEKCDMPFTKEPKKFCLGCGKSHHSKKDYCRNCQKCRSKKIVCECGNDKNSYSKNCMKCYCLNKRKVKNRPSKKQLEILIWNEPLTKIGKKYGVSDNCIRKWCRLYGIDKFPDASYRRRKFLGLI